MKDDSKGDKGQGTQDDDETPAIYSVGHVDDQPTFSRRTFLEIAAMAAGTAVLPSGCCCATRPTGRVQGTGPATAHKDAVTALAVNTTGTLLASGGKDGALKLWQLPQGALLHSWTGHTSPISELSFPHMEDALWSLDSFGALKRWHLPDGKEISGGKFMPGSHMFAVPSAADWYAVRTTAGGLELRSQTTGETLLSLQGLGDTVNALAVTSDGRLLLAGGASGNVGLWTEPIGTHVQTVEAGPAAVSALTIAAKGTLALSAHANGRLGTWKMPELQPGSVYQSSLGKPFCVAIRPQLDLFVVGSEKPDIGLWKLAPAAAEPRKLSGHTAAVRATVITPDGSLLISGSEDKTIRLWSLPDGKFLTNLVDLAINYKHVEGTSYKGTDIYGRTITFTLPCGSPIPPGAVCTCNCVPGSMTIPNNYLQRYNTQGYCTCDLICTCNTVCTCQSVGRGYGGYTYTISYWYPN
jgi:WD40 repeat protein